MRVAVDPFTRMAPSIEATTANMQALLERVQADMRAGQAKRLPNGAAAGREPVAADHEPATAGHEPATRRMPKGLWGQREYWLKPPKSGAEGRWLKKMREKPGDTSKQDRPPEMTTGTPLRKTPPPPLRTRIMRKQGCEPPAPSPHGGPESVQQATADHRQKRPRFRTLTRHPTEDAHAPPKVARIRTTGARAASSDAQLASHGASAASASAVHDPFAMEF